LRQAASDRLTYNGFEEDQYLLEWSLDMLKQVDSCATFDEVWTLRSKDISMWQCIVIFGGLFDYWVI